MLAFDIKQRNRLVLHWKGPVKFETIGVNMQLQTSTECKPKQKPGCRPEGEHAGQPDGQLNFCSGGLKQGAFECNVNNYFPFNTAINAR